MKGIKRIYQSFKRRKSYSILFVLFIILIGIFSKLIANDKPILTIGDGKISMPIFSNSEYMKGIDDFEVWPIIPYHSKTIDFDHMNSVSPFETQEVENFYYRHWLGTDELGRDLLAGIIHGCKTAVLVGFGSMMIALFLGLLLGGISGYFKNDQLITSNANYIAYSFSSILFILLSTTIPPWSIDSASFLNICLYVVALLIFSLLIATSIRILLKRMSYFNKNKSLPIDNYVMRLIELLESVPLLFLIICLSALFKPSYESLLIVIGFSSWTGIAKFTRAEVLKIKEQNYIESSLALGLSSSHIIRKHILPNALPPIFISLAFGIASAILIESTLSFLGIGLGAEHVSWGSILAGARSDYQSWWLVVFPGILLFLTIYSLNKIGEKFVQ